MNLIRKNEMTTIYTEPEQTEKKHYKGEAEASDVDKVEVGGEKSLVIQNILFQSDADAGTMATALLERLKDKKGYFSGTTEFLAMPVQRGDGGILEEYVSSTKSIIHAGRLRSIRLDITPTQQTLEIILEE